MLVKLQDSQEAIMMNNTIMSIGEAMETRRKINPNSLVCYHDETSDPSAANPGFFKLTTKQRVVAVLSAPGSPEGEKEPVKPVQTNVASCVPLDTWLRTSSAFKVVWSMRWTAAGLMPVRPQLVALVDVTIPEASTFMIAQKA